jgi:endoglycosylceramidase
VLLRGFNVDALTTYPLQPPAAIDDTDALLIQRHGFNVVRLGIDWAQLEPGRGKINHAYIERVADTVRMLNGRNLYVILDMHFRLGWSPKLGDSGAPPWATVDLPNWNPLPQTSWGVALSPAVAASNTYFWFSSRGWQAEFSNAWKEVALRFKDNPGVAGYDIYNEPHPLPIPPKLFEKYWMWPMYQRVIEGIGSVDPNHLFLVEGILLLSLETTTIRFKAPNLVYGVHVYEGSLVPPAFGGDRHLIDDRFRLRAREAREIGAPLWIGEIGHDLTNPMAAQYADVLMDNADDLGIGWAWWQWRQNRYWGIRDASGNNLNRDFLKHLARPYLMAAPEGIKAGRGDGLRGHLEITVSRNHGTSPIVVGWSTLTLPAPNVTGDCIRTSQWDAVQSRLTINLRSISSCKLVVESGPV